jgi:hypothetical protein
MGHVSETCPTKSKNTALFRPMNRGSGLCGQNIGVFQHSWTYSVA